MSNPATEKEVDDHSLPAADYRPSPKPQTKHVTIPDPEK